jgi:ribosome biogenesis GTPase
MREIQLWDPPEQFGGTFGDIEALAAECRFRDCRHQQEPGCAVRRAVESGELAAGRVESYHKLQSEQAHHARQIDQRAQLDEKRKARRLTKAANKHIKDKRPI